MHICIIGGGVIGTACAYQLVQQGIKTTLVETETNLGQKTSFANAGQLSYSYVAPLADPSIFADLPKWLLRRDSPLKFRPTFDYQQWQWLLHFLRACNSATQTQSTAALLSLSYLSREKLHHWIAQDHLSFNHSANGKLVVFESAKSWHSAQKQVAKQKALGSSQSLLNPSELVALEPATESMRSRIQGAVYTPSEEIGDCYLFVRAMQKVLEKSKNFTLLTGTRAKSFISKGQTVDALITDQNEVQADHYIVCAGMESRQLLKPLGYDPILFPLKGYSLTLTNDPSMGTLPKISVTDYARRIVYAPLGQHLRIAAMIDIHNTNSDPDPKRIEILKKQVHQSFPNIPLDKAQVWAGLRPATPTGRPLIGRCPNKQNLWMNIGHGSLGFTLAAGSAQLMSDLVLAQKPSIDVTSFTPH